MPTDDEIREICARLLTTDDSDFESVVQELQRALHSRFEKLSNLAVATILKMPGSKRSNDDKDYNSESREAQNTKPKKRKNYHDE